jgi:hypothetical protein
VQPHHDLQVELAWKWTDLEAQPAWCLIGRCVASVFDCMSGHRAKVALLEDPTPIESKAKHIWCILQCHMAMERFIAVKFQGDPVIVTSETPIIQVAVTQYSIYCTIVQ